MENRYKFSITSCLLLLFMLFFTNCNDEIVSGQGDDVKGMIILPDAMEIGQTISIVAPNLKNATAVIFPDNIKVSTFKKVGDLQIDVVVPVGTRSGGNITIETPDGDFEIPISIRLLNPKVTNSYPQSGAPDIGPYETLVIVGEDLINVVEIVFPGEGKATVAAMDFKRKGNEEIIVVVPSGTAKVVGQMKLKTKYGAEIMSTPVDFTGGGYIPPEYILLCGDDGSGKTWSWDEELDGGIVYGNGGYRSNFFPAWWKVHIESLSSGISSNDAFGAEMTFSFSYEGSTIVKKFVDGSEIEGIYKLDMTQRVNMSNGNPWSIGRLEIISGHENITILGGIGSRWGALKGFDILKLTDSELVLANEYPDEPGTAAFYMFRARK